METQYISFDEWKILDGENHELQKTQADLLEESGPEHYSMSLAGKTALLDKNLKIILPPIYDYVSRDDHGNRVVGIKNQIGRAHV